MARSEERGDLIDDQFAFPMSQQQIADFTGLTPVHTCRVLSALRKAGVCDVGHGTVKVIDRAELQRIAAFNVAHAARVRQAAMASSRRLVTGGSEACQSRRRRPAMAPAMKPNTPIVP